MKKLLLVVLFLLVLVPVGVALAQTQADDPTHCFVSHPSLLRAGDTAVVFGGPANVRSTPSLSGDKLSDKPLPVGTEVIVKEDPVCTASATEGFVWVEVQYGAVNGYIAEVGGNGYHLIKKGTTPPVGDKIKYENGPLYPEATAEVTPEATVSPEATDSASCTGAPPTHLAVGATVKLVDGFDYDTLHDVSDGSLLMSRGVKIQLLPGQTANVLAGPECSDASTTGVKIIWWQIQLSDNHIGWVPELQWKRDPTTKDLRPDWIMELAGNN